MDLGVRAPSLLKSAWWCILVTLRSRKQGFKFKACLSSEIKRGVRHIAQWWSPFLTGRGSIKSTQRFVGVGRRKFKVSIKQDKRATFLVEFSVPFLARSLNVSLQHTQSLTGFPTRPGANERSRELKDSPTPNAPTKGGFHVGAAARTCGTRTSSTARSPPGPGSSWNRKRWAPAIRPCSHGRESRDARSGGGAQGARGRTLSEPNTGNEATAGRTGSSS